LTIGLNYVKACLGVRDKDIAIEIGFDVIGFRGAACDGGRMGSISKDRIDRIINEVKACNK